MKKIGILFIFIILVLIGCIKNTSNHNTKKAPDLIVSKIELIEDCKIKITIKNIGTGGVYYPGSKAVVQMFRNNVNWQGLRLGAIDPEKKLRTPGASISYIWFPNVRQLKLGPGMHKMTLKVDTHDIVKESNERNNKKTVRLECKEENTDILELSDKIEIGKSLSLEHKKIKKSLRLENLKINKSIYSEGEPIYITYELVNKSNKKVNIPLNKDYSKPMYIIGVKQAWIEPLDKKKVHYNYFGGAKKQGNRYPAGGSIIRINKDHLSANEILPFNFTYTHQLIEGHYKYYLELRSYGDGSLINEKIIEFTVKK